MKFDQPEIGPPAEEQLGRRVRPHKKSKKGLKRIVLLSLALLLGLFVYNVVALMKFFDRANQNQFAKVGNDVQTTAWNGSDRVNILFLGVDNRDKDVTPRSDSMMILSFDPDSKRATLLSVMRDTYVTVPGYGKNKINTAFAIGGPNLSMKTVESFVKLPIHYYVVTDFQGFEGIIDAIGGVDINVEIPMQHADDGVYDINLKQGMQRLNGREALQYVRYRGDPRSDFARTERQRTLVKEVMSELKTPLTLVRFPSMLRAAEPYVQTNMNASDILRLSTDILQVETSGLKSVQIPPDNLLTETYNYLGESILEPDVKGIQSYVKSVLANDGQPISNNPPATVPASGSSSNPKPIDPANGTTKNPQPEAKTAGLSATVSESANVRQGPGTDQPILTGVYPGNEFTVLSQQADWYKVELQDGTIGYIYAPLVVVNAQ